MGAQFLLCSLEGQFDVKAQCMFVATLKRQQLQRQESPTTNLAKIYLTESEAGRKFFTPESTLLRRGYFCGRLFLWQRRKEKETKCVLSLIKPLRRRVAQEDKCTFTAMHD